MKFKGTWLPERVYKEYRNSCKNVDLSNFKTNPKYIGVVGNDTRKYDITEKFYSYVDDNYNTLLNYYDKFSTNDKIGKPVTHKFSDYTFSCGTLRFIKVLGDIFIKMKWNVNFIIEIGCGYGGQAKIFKDYKPDIKYTCVDIPEACTLITKYLNHFKLLDSVKIQDTSNIKPIKADLVISDYCLSELDAGGVDFYIDTFIKDAKYGYFTINKQASVRNHLLNRLRDVFSIVLIETEIPATSRHKNEILYCM